MPISVILGLAVVICAFAISVGYLLFKLLKFLKHPIKNYKKFKQEIEEQGDFEEAPTF